jgi:hypothetical protein
MTSCCSLPVDENGLLIEISDQVAPKPNRAKNICPECGQKGKPVDTATVKSQLSVSLRQVKEISYLFCRTRTCPVVYFSSDGEQVFTTEQVPERVYQKEPDAKDVFACYCFRHTIGEIQTASPEERLAILDDINAGIKAEQCACDWRNPQGACCLGNVREVIKQAESLTVATA